MNTYERVLVVMAMRPEAEPVLQSLARHWNIELPGETALDGRLPMRRWHFERPGGGAVDVVINGADPVHGVESVATQPATLTADAGIRVTDPDLVLTVGTAGALPEKARIGQVFHVSQYLFHDRRIFGLSPEYENYGVYPIETTALPARVGGADVPAAIISTGNSLNPVAEDFRIMQDYGAAMKEMEGAAVGWVAGLHGKAFSGVKAVTNVYTRSAMAALGSGRSLQEEATDFQANFEAATTALAGHMPVLLDELLGA